MKIWILILLFLSPCLIFSQDKKSTQSDYRATVLKNMELVYQQFLEDYIKTHGVEKDIFPKTVPREIILRVQQLSDEELKKHGKNEKESLERFRSYLRSHLDKIRIGVVKPRPGSGMTEEQAFHAKEHRDESKFKQPEKKTAGTSKAMPKVENLKKRSRWPDFMRYLIILLPVALILGFMSSKGKRKKKGKSKGRKKE